MKLKKFDFKLPDEDKRKKKIILTSISVITIILILTIASTFAYYQSIDNQNPIEAQVGEFNSADVILSVVIDGQVSSSFPDRWSGYLSSNVTCDKGASGKWNNVKWSIEIENVTQSKTTCNVFFTTQPVLKDLMLAQFGGESAIEIAPTNTFNTASVATTKAMYKMEDDYGDSYYYRGAKTLLDNNLIFAGYQWKIVRINGDGSIRIIYNGECPNNTCAINTVGTTTQLYGNVYSFNATATQNTHLGYMYGSDGSTIVGAQTNTIASAIKTYVETWYVNRIEVQGANITDKINETLFCNDRQIISGLGSNNVATNYAAYGRLYTNKTPTLKCAQQNDKFTLSDGSLGNADLIYPIGLISADEVALAGMNYGVSNSTNYLNTNQNFWTMTPSRMYQGAASMWIATSGGELNFASVAASIGTRVVLSLKPEVLVTGDGSATNPFKVI